MCRFRVALCFEGLVGRRFAAGEASGKGGNHFGHPWVCDPNASGADSRTKGGASGCRQRGCTAGLHQRRPGRLSLCAVARIREAYQWRRHLVALPQWCKLLCRCAHSIVGLLSPCSAQNIPERSLPEAFSAAAPGALCAYTRRYTFWLSSYAALPAPGAMLRSVH